MWDANERRFSDDKQGQVKNLDGSDYIFSAFTHCDEKFISMDIQFCDDGTVPRTFIIGSTRNRIQRYEILFSSESNLWECVDFVDLDVPDLSVQLIALSGTAALSATFGGTAGEKDFVPHFYATRHYLSFPIATPSTTLRRETNVPQVVFIVLCSYKNVVPVKDFCR